MDYGDVIRFAKENPACCVATVDGDQPRVRHFLTVFFDDVIHFTTGASKDVFAQIKKNPRVELCYWAGDFSRTMRITGEFEIIDDREKKRKLIEEKEYLKGLTPDDPVLILLRLRHGRARFWSLKDNMKERELEQIDF